MLQTSDSYFVNDLDNLVKILRHKRTGRRRGGQGAGRKGRSRKQEGNSEQIIDIINFLLSLCDRTSYFRQNAACCGHVIDIKSEMHGVTIR
jgi:hypothetical protein